MKHIKLFNTLENADGQLICAPFISLIKNNKNNINLKSPDNNIKLYGIFIDDSNNIKVDTVPSIPMVYLYFIIMVLYRESPIFLLDLYNLAINSYAGQYVDYGVIKWPNKEMKFNISDVDNFFNSIDSGIATKNNFFMHPVILPTEVDQMKHMMSYFNITSEYIPEEKFIQITYELYNNLMLCFRQGLMYNGNIFAYNIYKDNHLLFNFNSDLSMMFTDNIENIKYLIQLKYSEYLPYFELIYELISSIDMPKYFFVTILAAASKFNVVGVIGCITDNDTYFIFVPTKQ